jgi:hypothetical protein
VFYLNCTVAAAKVTPAGEGTCRAILKI